MTAIRARFVTGLALSAAVIFGAPSASGAQTLGPVQSETAPNGFPGAHCSHPAAQEALRIKQLSTSSKSCAAWRCGPRCCWPMSAIMKPSSRRAVDACSPLRPGESRCRRGEFRIQSRRRP